MAAGTIAVVDIITVVTKAGTTIMAGPEPRRLRNRRAETQVLALFSFEAFQKKRRRGHILQPFNVLFCHFRKPASVHVVLKISDLDSSGGFVPSRTLDEIFVFLAFPFRDALQRFDDFVGETFLREPFERPISVFDNVVKYSTIFSVSESTPAMTRIG